MLDADRMLREAKALVGLDRFDADDVEDKLRRLADAINEETQLNAGGEERFHIAGKYLLANRLLLTKLLEDHPEIRDADIGPAIMIVGLPRTGSTKLQRLIAQDPRLDHLTLLDVALPLRFPHEERDEIRRPLIRSMETALGKPELLAAHNLATVEPEEEVELQKNHFTARLLHDHVSIPKWQAFIRTLDVRPKLHIMRQMIAGNKMQRGLTGMAWVLKNAYGGEDIAGLAEVFPNAKFIVTHRDPVAQLGSITAIGHHWRRFHSDIVTKEQSGREYLHFWSDFANRMLDGAARVDPSRIFHVRYKDTLKDPLSAIKEVYAFLGYDLTSEAEQRMRAYDAQNAQHAHGKHDYTIEEFGLSRDVINKTFSRYLDVHGDKV